MAAGLECYRKINLVDMLPFLLLECDLPCYVGAEIKKDESRPYLMGDHLPAFCMEIHRGYRVFECAERSFNPHMKWYISLIASVADVPVVASQFGMQVFLFL